MCITADTTIPETIRERFETVLPDGTVSAASIDDSGRSAFMPGRIDDETFAEELNALLSLASAAGLIEDDSPAHGHTADPFAVMHRFAVPEIEVDGSLTLRWCEIFDGVEIVPTHEDAIAVTYYEFI